MKTAKKLLILICVLFVIHIAVRFIIDNDGIPMYDYNKNVYVQNIPEGYEIFDDRIFVKEENYVGLRLKLGDNIIRFKHNGKEMKGFLVINHDDDGVYFSSIKFLN